MPSYLRINQVTSLHQSFPVLPLGCQSHLKKVAFRTLLQRFLINSLPGHLRICNNPRHFYEEVKSFLLSRSRAHLGFLLYYLYIYFSLSLFIYWIFFTANTLDILKLRGFRVKIANNSRRHYLAIPRRDLGTKKTKLNIEK